MPATARVVFECYGCVMAVNKRLLVAGFHINEVNAFGESLYEVVSAFVNMDHRQPLPELPFEAYKHHDVVRCYPEVQLRLDFASSLRQQLYENSFGMFRRHYARITFLKNRSMRSWIDMDNMFHISANFFFDLIQRNRITTVVFSNIPHEGSYIVLYELAKLMGLEVIITTQSQFSGRLWIIRSIDDFGIFQSTTGDGNALPTPAAPESPFYMKRRKRNRRILGTITVLLREAIKLLLKLLTLALFFNKKATERNLSRFYLALDRLKLSSNPSQEDVREVDLDEEFVYFPLHLQPEMTTDTLGFAYADQLLAIEELAAALPAGTLIYAKENPIQTKFMREPSFYRRLRAIPNLRYVGEHVPTFDLIRNSLFVATISGTAGYEAALMGKGAIHFGVAWYATLPGVFRWQGAETVAKALAVRPDRTSLETAFDALTRKLYPGVVDPHYGVLIKDFKRDVEGRRAVESILSVIRDTT